MALLRAAGLGSAMKNAVVLTEAGKYLNGKNRVSTILK
jgi:hydroxymethylpyrimidine pyrophosphatase-like HAD family hydrolase